MWYQEFLPFVIFDGLPDTLNAGQDTSLLKRSYGHVSPELTKLRHYQKLIARFNSNLLHKRVFGNNKGGLLNDLQNLLV
jgi:hypothetical protein